MSISFYLCSPQELNYSPSLSMHSLPPRWNATLHYTLPNEHQDTDKAWLHVLPGPDSKDSHLGIVEALAQLMWTEFLGAISGTTEIGNGIHRLQAHLLVQTIAQVSEESLRRCSKPESALLASAGGGLCHNSCVLHSCHLWHQESQICSCGYLSRSWEASYRISHIIMGSEQLTELWFPCLLGVTHHPLCHIVMKPAEDKD